jgi:hypothetical protein
MGMAAGAGHNRGGRSGRGLSRREFLRRYGIASSALTISPFFLSRLETVCRAAAGLTRVYVVRNGTYDQNIVKLWEMLDGPARYFSPDDVIVIKGNAQWPNQGYTHTGCIKAVIDQLLALPGFSGEIIICDNTTNNGEPGATGFDATPGNRTHNWPDHNWNSLAAEYRAQGKPVATKRLVQGPWRSVTFPGCSVWNPAEGEGWTRCFFSHNGLNTYFSHPVFESPLTPGRMIDMKNGVWESGRYTGRRVRALFMPTLNNHGWGGEDYAGVTSAIKSFFGATEIHIGDDATWNGFYHLHSASFTQGSAQTAGELVGRYIQTMYAPVLYITCAIWAGWHSRTGDAVETKTVLACENPVTLDYIACRDVISPYASWLNPDDNNNTRKQILGCLSRGIGTIDPQQIEVITFDFNRPTATRLDVERKFRDFKAGRATEQDVKDTIKLYMEGDAP